MTWNYRIIDHGDWFGLHEVYYTDGRPTSYTSDCISFACDKEEGARGIHVSLAMALKDALAHEAIDVRELKHLANG